jgi:hypothetical protein
MKQARKYDRVPGCALSRHAADRSSPARAVDHFSPACAAERPRPLDCEPTSTPPVSDAQGSGDGRKVRRRCTGYGRCVCARWGGAREMETEDLVHAVRHRTKGERGKTHEERTTTCRVGNRPKHGWERPRRRRVSARARGGLSAAAVHGIEISDSLAWLGGGLRIGKRTSPEARGSKGDQARPTRVVHSGLWVPVAVERSRPGWPSTESQTTWV